MQCGFLFLPYEGGAGIRKNQGVDWKACWLPAERQKCPFHHALWGYGICALMGLEMLQSDGIVPFPSGEIPSVTWIFTRDDGKRTTLNRKSVAEKRGRTPGQTNRIRVATAPTPRHPVPRLRFPGQQRGPAQPALRAVRSLQHECRVRLFGDGIPRLQEPGRAGVALDRIENRGGAEGAVVGGPVSHHPGPGGAQLQGHGGGQRGGEEEEGASVHGIPDDGRKSFKETTASGPQGVGISGRTQPPQLLGPTPDIFVEYLLLRSGSVVRLGTS